MAASSQIGQVRTIYLKSYDNIGNKYETNINGKSFSVNYNATYEQVDSAMRALNQLTTNIYEDTELVTYISVNEKMEEE